MAVVEQLTVFAGFCDVVCSSGRQLSPFLSECRKRFVPITTIIWIWCIQQI
jgi:hypothetical protein